jgi:tryptophan 2,3-dioxygenase
VTEEERQIELLLLYTEASLRAASTGGEQPDMEELLNQALAAQAEYDKVREEIAREKHEQNLHEFRQELES